MKCYKTISIQNKAGMLKWLDCSAKMETGAFMRNERVGGLVYGSALLNNGVIKPVRWIFRLKRRCGRLIGRTRSGICESHSSCFTHPGRTAEIKMQGQTIGFMGELHPQWLQKYDLPQAHLVFELDMAAVLASDKITYQTVSKFQAARRDLAFVLPENTEYAALLAALRGVKAS